MIENRIARRTDVRLDANVSTVLASGQGTVTDLSETGAKVQFAGLSVGQRVSIEVFGQDVYGLVAWADPDRFGMKFDQTLRSGPLHSYLGRLIAPAPRQTPFPHAAHRPVFGRRAA
jgi:hypothetical protein